ncbi:DUF4139 domain-containing protein [Sphingosinicella sp. YJ22]|uniref:DUF4139 domain-containing protein n=1 Tax=Sphingosinicella sp. YJ22 TaxID=1104780 RepID=UPI00140B8AF7|nr:DUF4139 domain-containing protein [Sphingosinicella sp. YJ22]
MRRLLPICAFIAAPALAQDNAIPPPGVSAQGDVSVTIYNNDLALVQDVRQLNIASGRVRQEFPDVSARIQPQTVTMTGDGLEIVEQNFDFDLLSPQALMQKAVGETITLVRTIPTTGAETREQARVLAVNGGVVLQIGNRIEVLRDDGMPVRVIFDRVPENLRARPTLSVTFDSRRGGPRPVNLTYLTNGLAWQADYVALFDQAAGRMDVQGWITLTNNSGTEYRNANTLLVAGNVEANSDQYRYSRPTPPQPGMRQAGTESADRERIGDYYLYPLPERTTIANRQTKQVSFLDVSGAQAQRAYEYRNGWLATFDEPQNVNTVLRFSSSRDQGLGDALPAGTVRVYQRDARGNPQFVGESRIGHTPMGSELGLVTGQAFDVKVQPVVENRQQISEEQWRLTDRFRITHPDGTRTTGERETLRRTDHWQTQMRYTVTNARPEPVTVSVYQSGLGRWWADSRIVQESLPHERVSDDQVVWRVPVPANGTVNLNVTYQTRY